MQSSIKGIRASIFLVLLFFSMTNTSAQLNVGVSLGVSNYAGDLPALTLNDGIKIELYESIGVYARYALHPVFHVRAEAFYTRIGGNDGIAETEDLRRRNLSFRSPVYALMAGVEVHPFGFGRARQNRVSPFLFAGVGFYHFNPRTIYQGEWVDLHPLNTEGQGLAEFPGQEEYRRGQFKVPVGGGLKYRVNALFTVGLEMFAFFTFTDYLDDVSTIYISYPELLELKGPLTAALANRMGEYLNEDPKIVPTGTSRGNDSVRDIFTSLRLTVAYALDAFGGRRKGGRYDSRCPKF